MARSRGEEFGAWAKRASNVIKTQIPRRVTFASLSPEGQETVNARGRFAGENLLNTAEQHLSNLSNKIANFGPEHREEYTSNVIAEHKKLSEQIGGLREALSGKEVDFSEEGLSSNFRSLVDAGYENARRTTRFRQQHTGSDVLEIPSGGVFYADHPARYLELAKKYMGGGIHNAERLVVAGAEFSVNSPPRDELRAASGMARFDAAGDSVGVDINHHAARYLNDQAKRINKGSKDIEPGSHRMVDLPAEHSALIVRAISDIANKKELHPALRRGLRLGQEAKELQPAAMDIVAGAQKGGVPSIARSTGIMRDIGRFSNETDFLKVGTYATLNVLGLRKNKELRASIKHMMGASTHGNKYWDKHPEALEQVDKMQSHPLMNHFLAVSDVHAARSQVNPGGVLNIDQLSSLDERIRPEALLAGQSRMPGGSNFPTVMHEGKAVSPVKLGFLLQEQAMVRNPTKVPAKGRTLYLPGHVDQAVGWVQQQIRYPSSHPIRRALRNAAELGLDSGIDSDVESNPQINVNPSITPKDR